MRHTTNLFGALLVGCALLLPITGCSTEKTTTTTTTDVVNDPNYPASSTGTTRVETTTKTVDTDHDDHHSEGIFSILGDIIALPFRAVGALLSAIF